MTKYNLIFTKLDETDTIGNIYNLRVLTSAPLRMQHGDKMYLMISVNLMHKRLLSSFLEEMVDGSGTTA